MGRICIAAGGTGGHVFPALSVAKALIEKGHSVLWLGSQRGIENRLIPTENIPLYTLDMRPFRYQGIKRWLTLPYTLTKAQWQAYHWLSHHKSECVLAMGGYVAAPVGMAAIMMRTPLIVHEQNTCSGMTNRILSKCASEVLCGFDNHNLKNKDVKVTGNPLMSYPKECRTQSHTPLRVLVIGGSQGSRALNTILPGCFSKLAEGAIEIWHQCGNNRLDETKKAYQSLPCKVNVSEFIQPMSEAYDWCDCVVSRSGAMTVSEVSAHGKPAVFIPFPQAVDDHQTCNAEWLVNHKAAWICPEDKLSTTSIIQDFLSQLINDPDCYASMASASYELSYYNATQLVVDECEKYLSKEDEYSR
ncbi:MAG TPA: undecaprenyldiphospho-muramoylpentapeptide beta-N-acetylglucosaminyltransferase [Gammaproteobacteria bacterium]|nr:undecaprenyldiphospho-muramoylpentapeptide beta-N-acetylglucosaminyltransferase [Gammaproteobacteria bacterium]